MALHPALSLLTRMRGIPCRRHNAPISAVLDRTAVSAPLSRQLTKRLAGLSLASFLNFFTTMSRFSFEM
jgi:hypothetical protein